MTSFIEGREIGVTLVSAQNLPDIRLLGRMKVYAQVSLNGIPETTMITDVDKDGETDPTWNSVARYKVGEVAVQLPGVNLVVKLCCKRSGGDKLIGEVKIPLKNLFDDTAHESKKILSYHVEGTPNGVLNISCSFGEKIAVLPDRPAPPQNSDDSDKQVLGFVLGVVGLFLK